MKVEGVFTRRKVMQVELERDARALIPDRDAADVFSLRILQFDFCLGEAQR